MQSNMPRMLNVVLGAWLFISTFLWTHSAAQSTNSWVVGLLVVVFALVAMRYAQARFINAALAVWLFLSVWLLPTQSTATFWNHLLVAIAIFFVSLVPSAWHGRHVSHRPAPMAR